jgi:hypothetical protein
MTKEEGPARIATRSVAGGDGRTEPGVLTPGYRFEKDPPRRGGRMVRCAPDVAGCNSGRARVPARRERVYVMDLVKRWIWSALGFGKDPAAAGRGCDPSRAPVHEIGSTPPGSAQIRGRGRRREPSAPL